MTVRWFSRMALTSVLLAGVAFADDPDPTAIVKKADDAAKALKAVSYKAKCWGEGSAKDNVPTGDATIITQRVADDERPPLFRLEGELTTQNGTRKLNIAIGEKTAVAVRAAEKEYVELPGEHGQMLLANLDAIRMQEYTHPAPFSDELNGDARKYEGKKSIGGVECHVIMVTYAGGTQKSRWYFSAEDGLPRRVDRIFDEEGARITEVHDLNTKPKIDEKTFSVEIPSGYSKAAVPTRGGRSMGAAQPSAEPEGLLQKGSAAPDFSLNTPDGKTVTLASLKGKVVVLDFWATWCGPCKLAMPGIQRISADFKDRGVAVYGVNIRENEKADPAKFMQDNAYTYGLLLKGDDVSKRYRVQGIPAFFVIDREGKVLYSATGYSEDNEKKLREVIDAAVNKPQ